MPHVIDGREMVPPEPLEATLAALDGMSDDDELLLLLYCRPHPLFNILRGEGYVWSEELQADGTREVRIRKA
ncbi:MAG: DUF2249 domain-containing protein [Gammaproteobacteria bacterium]|nr:DUF2249 domain-containing protein [Gammaproteobacteria bacterium]MBU1415648.1 DUF2249 domain-containing protein [Gammaproteobacteria bacterium]